jgi:hypothetical protein
MNDESPLTVESIGMRKSFPPVGHKRWLIAGLVLEGSEGSGVESVQDAVCVMNISDQEAHLELTLFFAEREPEGPHRVTVSARRLARVPLAQFANFEQTSEESHCGCVIESDVPVVVHHVRPGTQVDGSGPMATMGYADIESVIMP